MKIKRNASFKLFTYGKHNDKYQIRLRVKFNSQQLDLGTNCQLNNIEAWNAEEDAEEKAVQVGLNNTTIKKKLEYLTWFLRWARDVGYPVNPAFKTFKPTLKQTQKPIIYLSKEELLRVKNLDLSGSKLEPVRDIFLFCCFSSLRHSDADNLRRSDIKGDHMDVTTIKTGVEVQFNDNEKTKEFVITIPRKEHHINAPSNEGMHQVSNQGSLKSNEGPLKSNQGEVTKVTRLPITKKQLDIVNFCSVPRSAKEIMERLGITNQTNNRQRYITDLIEKGYLELTIPDNPTHMDQKYRRVRKK